MDDEMSRLQKCVALSSVEAEYVALAEVGKEMIWMTDYLEELDKKQREKILQVDSQSVMQLARNPIYHSKHRKRYHFTRRLVEDGDVFGGDRGCKESSKHFVLMLEH